MSESKSASQLDTDTIDLGLWIREDGGKSNKSINPVGIPSDSGALCTFRPLPSGKLIDEDGMHGVPGLGGVQGMGVVGSSTL